MKKIRYNNGYPPVYRRLDFPLSQAIPLEEFCKKHHISRSGAMYRILNGTLPAWKNGRYWLVQDPTVRS